MLSRSRRSRVSRLVKAQLCVAKPELDIVPGDKSLAVKEEIFIVNKLFNFIAFVNLKKVRNLF